jgi:hypothetical protein
MSQGLGRGCGVGRGLGIGVPLGVGVGRGVAVGVAVAVGVGVGVPPPVTVRVTGTATKGRTGSLLAMQTLAWCVPTVSSLASMRRVTSSPSSGGMLPEAGLSESQGTSVGGTQGALDAPVRRRKRVGFSFDVRCWKDSLSRTQTASIARNLLLVSRHTSCPKRYFQRQIRSMKEPSSRGSKMFEMVTSLFPKNAAQSYGERTPLPGQHPFWQRTRQRAPPNIGSLKVGPQ